MSRHLSEKQKRHARLQKGDFAPVQKPIINKNELAEYHPLPNFSESYQSVYDRFDDYRCFFFGVETNKIRGSQGQNPLINPWMRTKDHLVPLRRDVSDRPNLNPNSMVLCSYIANVTFGNVPFAVKLKVREWLSTTPYDRNDTSVENALNLRWLLIDYLNHFRIDGRFPWSKNSDNKYWNEIISIPFMERMYAIEKEFLDCKPGEKDLYIKQFNWNF